MAHWKTTVTIKDLLGSDESLEAITAAYTGIVERFKPTGLRLPAQFHKRAKQAIKDGGDTPIFNLGMDALYDWADRERIWLD